MAELELNKIVNMIMENPELIEKIKAMGAAASEEAPKASEESPKSETLSPPPAVTPRRSKRNELLRSLETFLSDERKKSLETMMTVADVIDSVRRKES